jgi:hypothetical protein
VNGQKHKQIPVLQRHHQTEKSPKALPQTDWWSRNPAWRISKLEVTAPFGWHEVSGEELHDIRKRLSHFESMTLHEIFVVARKQNHPVPVSDLCKHARDRLVQLRMLVDQLYSLRLSGEQRVWCTLTENVLTLLWWDPKHEVCPSTKKHT